MPQKLSLISMWSDVDLTHMHAKPRLVFKSPPLLSFTDITTFFFLMFTSTSCFPPFFLLSLQAFPVYPSVAPLASLSSECASQRSPHVLQMGALIR